MQTTQTLNTHFVDFKDWIMSNLKALLTVKNLGDGKRHKVLIHVEILYYFIIRYRYGLFIHTCVSTDVIFCLLWYNLIQWSSHLCRKSLFFLFHSLLFLVNNTGEVIELNWLSVTGKWDKKCHYAKVPLMKIPLYILFE